MITKFRAWHKEDEFMFEVHCIRFDEVRDLFNVGHKHYEFNPLLETFYPACEVELMQWTGLQDANGNDIYEGDLVDDIAFGIKRPLGVIKFGRHDTSSDYYASGAYGFYIEFSFENTTETEALYERCCFVKGNIYEQKANAKEEINDKIG